MNGQLRVAVIATLGIVPLSGALAQNAERSITQIEGDLYRFQNDFHFSVFLVTPEGVIATDPIDADAATWLEAEIQERFGQEVRYLILSHDHADHSSGGEVFADTATVIAHDNAKATIIGEGRPTAVPDISFSDRLTIELGGKTVELTWVGQSHSDNSIVMRFPDEGTLFAVDFISVKRLPYQDLSDAYFPEWIDAVRKVEAMDFEILAPGHGQLGTRQDVVDHRQYLEDLYDGVLAAMREGQSLDEIQGNLTLDAYADWDQYEAWRPMNIEGVYRQISLHRRGN